MRSLSDDDDMSGLDPDLMRLFAPEEIDGNRISDYEREAKAQEARKREEERLERRLRSIFRRAKPGENELSRADFIGLLDFAMPADEMPRQHKRAMVTGRIDWTNGIVFVRKQAA